MNLNASMMKISLKLRSRQIVFKLKVNYNNERNQFKGLIVYLENVFINPKLLRSNQGVYVA